MLNRILDCFRLPPKSASFFTKFLRIFYKNKFTVRAGTISYYKYPNNEAKILILKRKFRGGGEDWTFPKGGVEEGETDLQAAIRETYEEAGIKVLIKENLPDNNYIYFSDGKKEKVFTLVKYYLAQAKTDKIKAERSWEIAPNVASDFIEDGKWVSVDQALEMVKHETEKRILLAAKDKLRLVLARK